MRPFTHCSPPVCLLLVLLSCPPLSHANGVWFLDPVTGQDDVEGTTSDAPTTTQLVTTHTEMLEGSTGMLSTSGTGTTSGAPTTVQLVTTLTEMLKANTGMLSTSGTETTEDITATFGTYLKEFFF